MTEPFEVKLSGTVHRIQPLSPKRAVKVGSRYLRAFQQSSRPSETTALMHDMLVEFGLPRSDVEELSAPALVQLAQELNEWVAGSMPRGTSRSQYFN